MMSVPAGAESKAMAEQLARVAARLFAARGYDATPVRAIAEAAGVTKPTLYYYFGSKAGLAQALLTVPMTRLTATMEELLGRPGDPVGALAEMLDAHFAFCREDPDRSRFLYALLFGPLGAGLSAELGQFGERLTDLIARAVRRAAEAGHVDPDRADSCAAALRGLIVIHTMDFLYRGQELRPGLGRRLVAGLLEGFGAAREGRARTVPISEG